MKNLACIILLLINLNSIKGQEQIVPVELASEYRHDGRFRTCEVDNIYFKDVNKIFDKFVGNWIYKDENFEIEIVIKDYVNRIYKELGFETNIYDCAVLNYTYINLNNSETKTIKNLIGLKSFHVTDINKVKFSYSEPSNDCCDKALDETLEISINPANSNEINWKRTKNSYKTCRGDGLCIHGKLLSQEEAEVPNEITLVRK